ncbi:MAG: sulfotransferase domain-containing protein [Anaerolineae bacterium]|nr:sulfotransferase domain-containing protein [Anaerolineae bacterium]
MIVISAGMVKAGTGWYFNMTNDLLVATGHQHVHDVRDRFKLHDFMLHANCNISTITTRKLLRLMVPHLRGNTFVVKTHEGPNRSLRYFMAASAVKATYIYRDPRDVLLSFKDFIIEQRADDPAQVQALQEMDLKTSLQQSTAILRVWEGWDRYQQRFGNAFIVRYEDLKADPVRVMIDFVAYLGIGASDELIREIVAKYRPDKLDQSKTNTLHFNKGQTNRFLAEMTPDQVALANEFFAPYLARMGYELIPETPTP